MKKTNLTLDHWTAEIINRTLSSDPGFRRVDPGLNELTLDRAHLDRYKENKLRDTMKYALRFSRFYRAHLGPHIGDSFPEDDFMHFFESLPFTTPEDLRKDENAFICVHPSRIDRIVTLRSSGSTGKSKRICFTKKDQELTIDYFHHGMQTLVSPESRVLILMPAKRPGSIGKLLGEGLRRGGSSAVEYGLPGPDESQKILQLIHSRHITDVVAMPAHMRMLAELNLSATEVTGSSLKPCLLNSVLLSGEYVSDNDIQTIGGSFRCKVYEHYGMTEMGLGCAVSCGYGEGYHIRETDLYIEIIDPSTGSVIHDEQPGEIVFTTLTREGMPFIRYRTGDISRWITSPCPCGSLLKRLDRVSDRHVNKGAGRSIL